jgi:hypothetical protein
MFVPRPNTELMVADFILGFFAALACASLVAFIAKALPATLQKLTPVAHALWRQGSRLFDRSVAAISGLSISIGTRIAAHFGEATRRTRVFR